ncbi:MAG TPA: hypothetical protein VN238_02655 [Solirubrobacteraceae bacterium]|nr:hypothetical protein [Solirubrobacteraceae bacterium]
MHRFLVLAFLGLAALAALVPAAPARAESVAGVGGVPIERAAVEAERAAQQRDRPWEEQAPAVASAALTLVRREQTRQKAAALGIVVTQAQEDAAWARELAAAARPYNIRSRHPIDETRTRALLREAIARRLIFDRFYLEARDDAAYAARFTEWQQRQRAKTWCGPALGSARCGTSPLPRDACLPLWPLSACFVPATRDRPAYWSIDGDLAQPAWVYNNHDAQVRLRWAVRRLRPALDRRVEFDSEADFLAATVPTRADAVALVRIAHRLTLRKPTPPLFSLSVDG